MKQVQRLVVLFAFLLLSAKCHYPDLVMGEFTLEREDYLGSEIKTGGYWVAEYTFDSSYGDVYFLYRNGVMLSLGRLSSPINSISVQMKIQSLSKNISEKHRLWGVFRVNKKSITMQERSGQAHQYIMVYEERGTILNDSTFVMTYNERISPAEAPKPDRNEINVTYRFHSYSPKPDSTNIFIK